MHAIECYEYIMKLEEDKQLYIHIKQLLTEFTAESEHSHLLMSETGSGETPATSCRQLTGKGD